MSKLETVQNVLLLGGWAVVAGILVGSIALGIAG